MQTSSCSCSSAASKENRLRSAIRARDQQNRQSVENEHKGQINPGARPSAGEFLPGKNSPERRDHGGRLADGIRDGYSGETCSHKIENHAGAPDHAASQTKQMSRRWSGEEAGETHGFPYQRILHEINIPDEAREQSTEGEKNRNAIRAKRVAVGHRASYK